MKRPMRLVLYAVIMVALVAIGVLIAILLKGKKKDPRLPGPKDPSQN